MVGSLSPLIVRAASKHSATVIFVHGLGDTGQGWQPVADMFAKDIAFSHVKWVLPHAPTKPVTANMGMSMPSWFDIKSFGFDGEEDEKGMLETVKTLNDLISEEINSGISPSRIVLGGFSQGGAMSLLTGMSTELKLGGIVILSGWLPLRNKFKAMTTEHASRKLPIFWGHGMDDPLVQFQMGRKSGEYLMRELHVKPVDIPSGAGFDKPVQSEAGPEPPMGLSFHAYRGMMHSASNEELEDLHKWLKRVIPATEEK